MGKWIHRVSGADLEEGTVDCEACGTVPGERSDHNRFGMRCVAQKRTRGRSTRDAYGYHRRKKDKRDHCEQPGCTATIVDQCQLEMDHIDGDPTNNDPSNVQTLCCNCHRLKSKKERNAKRAAKAPSTEVEGALASMS